MSFKNDALRRKSEPWKESTDEDTGKVHNNLWDVYSKELKWDVEYPKREEGTWKYGKEMAVVV
jgi:hypothetical protein